jgi:hypothetical protein
MGAVVTLFKLLLLFAARRNGLQASNASATFCLKRDKNRAAARLRAMRSEISVITKQRANLFY